MAERLNIDPQEIRDGLARHLKLEMTLKGISIRKVAKLSGVSVASLVKYRAAQADAPLCKIYALAKAIGVEAKDLLPQ